MPRSLGVRSAWMPLVSTATPMFFSGMKAIQQAWQLVELPPSLVHIRNFEFLREDFCHAKPISKWIGLTGGLSHCRDASNQVLCVTPMASFNGLSIEITPRFALIQVSMSLPDDFRSCSVPSALSPVLW